MKILKWIIGIVVVIIVFGILASACSNAMRSAAGPGTVGPQSTVAPAVETANVPAKPVGPATVVGDGTYEVGTDMVAGKYKTTGSGGDSIMGCSYHVPDTTIFGYSKGPGVLTVKNGQELTLSGGCEWVKS